MHKILYGYIILNLPRTVMFLPRFCRLLVLTTVDDSSLSPPLSGEPCTTTRANCRKKNALKIKKKLNSLLYLLDLTGMRSKISVGGKARLYIRTGLEENALVSIRRRDRTIIGGEQDDVEIYFLSVLNVRQKLVRSKKYTRIR